MKRPDIVLVGVTVCAGLAASAALLVAVPLFAAAAPEAHVDIDNFSFGPAQLTVASGTRVTWANRDDIPHTVTDSGQPRSFKSSALDNGDSFSYVFTSPGTYHYFCSLHPHMQATVVVK